MKRCLSFLAALLCLPAVSCVFAETQITGIETDSFSGVDIRIISEFKQLPPAGFAPVQVLIRNNSGRTREWTFRFGNSGNWSSFSSTRIFPVENQSERTFEALIPLAVNENKNYSNNNIQITASGYGINRGNAQHYSSNGSGLVLTDYVLMSAALAVHSWGPLEKACEKAGHTLFGSEFNPNVLPTDWRGYAGVGSLWITDQEWQGLDATPRNVIHEWIAQGGRLFICSTASHAVAYYGFKSDRPGYGRVTALEWNGKELDPAKVKPEIVSRSNSLVEHLNDGYSGKWELPGPLNNLSLNAGFILGFVTCFAVIAGPLNLFWFAKSGRRHRLFWTTPLISLAGSAVLAVLIVMQDGFGGTGNRLVAVHLMPDEKEAIIIQEQFSRTGLLVSQRFQSPDPIFISPINNLPALSTKNPRHFASRSMKNHSYAERDNSYTGNWFSSRSMQAQLIHTTRPTRARIDVIVSPDGSTPVLLSSVENTLQEVFYVDTEGYCWHTTSLRTGERKALERSDSKAFEQWWTATLMTAGGRIRPMLDTAKARNGYFYALAEGVKNEAVPTLAAIHWKDQKVIYLGPCHEEKEGGQ